MAPSLSSRGETIPFALPWLGLGPRPVRLVPRGGGPAAARMDRPAPPTPACSGQTVEPLGARGPASGREFESANAGGPVRRLSLDRMQVTPRGIAVVERHLARFGDDEGNAGMVQRLREIAGGTRELTVWDRRFYTHELREFVRYRRLGWAESEPADPDAARMLWNDTHTATLEDYGLGGQPTELYQS